MTELITGGSAGLLLGMGLQLCGLSRRENVTGMLAFSRRSILRAVWGAAGLGILLTAFLTWLAVIDVDLLTILPLDGSTVIGGVLFGLAAGWAGLTPATALTGIGGGRLLESLCGAAGCAAGALLLPYAAPLFEQTRSLIPASGNTWFRVTLDGPYLFAGGFLGLGCIGLVVAVAALCIRPERAAAPEEPAPKHTNVPPPEEAADDTFTAILPGEEPLVVDTDEEDADMPEKPSDTTEGAADEEPILKDHPELEKPAEPEADTLTEEIRELETGAGMVTPSQQAALPADARVIDKAPPGEAAASPEDQDEAEREGKEQE